METINNKGGRKLSSEEESGAVSGQDDEERKQKKMKTTTTTTVSEETKWAIFSFEEDHAFRWIVFPVQYDDLLPLERNPVFPPTILHHGGREPLLETTTPHVHTFLSKHEARDYSVVVIDSVMYILGGFRHFKRSVKTCNLLAPSKGGGEIVKQCGPDILRARCMTLVLVLNKKLYVFGGHISSFSVQWTETRIALPVLPEFYDSYGFAPPLSLAAPCFGLHLTASLWPSTWIAVYCSLRNSNLSSDLSITDFTDLILASLCAMKGKMGNHLLFV